MLNLFLLRHGKASKIADSGQDYDRELNKKGTAQCNQIGYILREEGVKIDHVISSAAVRTFQTTKIVSHFLNVNDCSFFEELYLADVDRIVHAITKYGKGSNLLYVGHNFGISNVTDYLTGEMTQMSTGQLLHITFDIENWHMISSRTGMANRTIIPDVYAF